MHPLFMLNPGDRFTGYEREVWILVPQFTYHSFQKNAICISSPLDGRVGTMAYWSPTDLVRVGAQ